MHTYPLHLPFLTECLCCHVEREFTFTSQSDQVVCKSCIRHQGDATVKANQRDTDHVGLWHSELALAKEHHEEVIAQLQTEIKRRNHQIASQRTEIADLQEAVRAGVESAPLPAVERWFADEQVVAAHNQRDSAYRSRDHAYRALWATHRLHHEDYAREGHCSCGRRLNQCKELAATSSVAHTLDKWEEDQVERIQLGQPDGLPADHPAVLKYGSHDRRRRNLYRRTG